MTQVGKFLRSTTVRTLLKKALATLGPGCAMAVVRDGKTVICEPQESAADFDTRKPDAEVGLDTAENISLKVLCSTSIEAACSCAELAAYSIDQLHAMETARRSIADEALNKYRELALLHRSVPRFNTSLRLHDVVGALLNECSRESHPGEMGVIYLNATKSTTPVPSRSFGFRDKQMLHTLCHSQIFNDVMERGRAEIVNDVQKDPRWDDSITEIRALLAIPLISPNRVEGLLLLASRKPGIFQAAHQKHLTTMASVAGISLSNAVHFEETRILMDAILQALAEAIDSRDPFTAGHSRRVAQLAAAFANTISQNTDTFPEVQFSENEIREIYYAGILHDIGKIGIREEVLTKDSRLPQKTLEIIRARMELIDSPDLDKDAVFAQLNDLNKAMTPSDDDLLLVDKLGGIFCSANGRDLPLIYEDEAACLSLSYGNLTAEERDEIQRHPAESERILQHIPVSNEFTDLLTIIRQHHERMDGSGYPDGLPGDDLLLQSRLMAIVDIYDAVTQERHYKPALSSEEAVKILMAEANSGKLDRRMAVFFAENLNTIERMADSFRGGRSFLYEAATQLALHRQN
ncbi:HD domain-containing phosphohydrolase [Salidesulfovibrio brasiliensis]|uniref:HD domain-containing phosphohydrolase n=1 Tax=Salidesulfovibrio brasiliensis TaxID=221711 RepID=UPI0006D02A82|nr:HD domain-containing phosphohydrolase [Salidesulfovibrio brasiliensis]